jgi:hypothetical protein
LPAPVLQWSMSLHPHRRVAAVALAAAFAAPAMAADSATSPAQLRARFAELQDSLQRNAYGRPLHLESSEGGNTMRGEVHAVLNHPFRKVRDGLADAGSWCEVLALPFNVKRCEAHGEEGVSVYIGRTPQTPVEKAVRIDFRFTRVARSDDVVEVRLDAPSGPLGTRDYRLSMVATPAEANHTFMRMSYGYGYGALSKLAMQTYLSTSGASKVGFSSDGVDEQGRPRLVGGMRGVLERNTMRYFLAIDAYLDTLAVPAEERPRQRFAKWYDAVARYPRQLREMSREAYLALKEEDRAASRQRVAAR